MFYIRLERQERSEKLTKYRKSVSESVSESATKTAGEKTGSGYNPETWTEQFFREKREREEEIRKVEVSEGEKNQKGIPVEKGIPGHDESEVE